MLEGLRHLFTMRPWREMLVDALDIAIVAYLAYRVLLVLRGTRAMQVAMGLGSLFLLYLFGRWLQLVTLVSILSTLVGSIILVVVVLFQNDIRRGLMRAGSSGWFFGLARDDETRVIEEVVAAASELSKQRCGAIITIERDAALDEFLSHQGTLIDAHVTRELLTTVFNPVPENKLHDGAVIIRNLRLAYAGVFFHMPEKHGIEQQLGSRHRAAIAITADTDAMAIVVSEERGTITFCFQENHVDNVSPEMLRDLLRRLEQPKRKRTRAVTGASARRSIPPPGPTSSRMSNRPPSISIPPPPLAPTNLDVHLPVRKEVVSPELAGGEFGGSTSTSEGGVDQ